MMNDAQLQIIELSKRPINAGKLDQADIVKIGKNLSCGDQVSIYINLKGEARSENRAIEKIMFEGTGCSISIAAASLLSETLKGKSFDEVLKLGPAEIQKILGLELGPSRLKCALLPLDTIQQGIKENERK